MSRPETEPWSETTVKLTRASTVRTARQHWLWQGIIPLGVLTGFAGNGGEGKTTFALDVAARVTRGTVEGDLLGKPQDVILIGAEDDWAAVVVPRLRAAGADLERVFFVQAETVTEFSTGQRELKFPLDVRMLKQAVEQVDPALIIVDPISSAMSSGDMHKVQDVRAAIEPLAALAQDKGLSVILINHFNKGAGSVRNKVSGSHGLRDTLRSLLVFAKDEDTGERILTQDKNNYGTGLGSYKFTIESVDVTTDDGETTQVGRARFLGASDVSVEDIINRDPASSEDEDRNAAQEFLLDYLRGFDAHEAPAGDVIKAGAAAGFSRDEMKNARKRVSAPRVVSVKSSFRAGWVWQIDESEGEGAASHQRVTPSTPSQTEGGVSPGQPEDVALLPSDSFQESTVSITPSHTEGVEEVEGVRGQGSDSLTPTGICAREFCERTAAPGMSECAHHIELHRRMQVITGRQGDAA